MSCRNVSSGPRSSRTKSVRLNDNSDPVPPRQNVVPPSAEKQILHIKVQEIGESSSQANIVNTEGAVISNHIVMITDGPEDQPLETSRGNPTIAQFKQDDNYSIKATES
ncbi:hypothetical protein Tco_0787469 [Tanacetum coccineum]